MVVIDVLQAEAWALYALFKKPGYHGKKDKKNSTQETASRSVKRKKRGL
jgi:hypothetical protein